MPTAIITGASTGIGRDLASICAKAGYDTVVIARNASQLEELAAQIRKDTGRRVQVLPCDLAEASAPAAVFEQLRGQSGEIEIFVNNAGIGTIGPFVETENAKQMQMLHLNICALTELSRLFLPGMIARRSGYLMNVASTAAFQPGPRMAVYYASKAYVLSLSEALHNELKGTGVSVTCLCPGPTTTAFQERAGMGQKVKLMKSPSVMDSFSVAQAGFRGMMARKSVVIPGMLNAATAFMTRFAPRQLSASIAGSLNRE